MQDNVVVLPVVTSLPISPERVLQAALENHGDRPFSRALVIAVFDDDGEEYFASSDPDGGTILWDMARAHRKLMKVAEGED